METIATFLNPEEARVARSYLAANGIDALLKGEESLSVMPHLGMGAKSWQLMVSDADTRQAQHLLALVEEAARDNNQAEQTPPDALKRSRQRQIFFAAALIASAFVILFGSGKAEEADKRQREVGTRSGPPHTFPKPIPTW